MSFPQSVLPPPSSHFARWQALTIILGAALWLPLTLIVIGSFLLIFAIAVALIADWHGATTLRGLIDWSRVPHARWLVITLFVMFYMFAFYVYAWRVFHQTGEAARLKNWTQQSAKNKALAIIAVTALVIANVVACASIGSQQNTTDAIASKKLANLNQNSATQTATAPAKAGSTTGNASISATRSPTNTAVTAKPTNTPIPPTATPRPPTPKPAPPRPTAIPAPRYPAVGGNPWDYTLVDTGKVIYNPPPNICVYINCIPSFWDHTNGYVDECGDGMYSHSGGIRGACSYHGGEQQPLYQP
jgi:hypothetical protein